MTTLEDISFGGWFSGRDADMESLSFRGWLGAALVQPTIPRSSAWQTYSAHYTPPTITFEGHFTHKNVSLSSKKTAEAERRREEDEEGEMEFAAAVAAVLSEDIFI